MDGGVVEFHALADTDGACTQHHDLLAVRQPGSILAGVGGVEVGDISAGVAGIHHLEDGEDVFFLTQVVNFDFFHAPQLGDVLIAEAHGLGGLEGVQIPGSGQLALHGHDILDGFQEVGRDLGDLEDFVHTHIPAQQLGNGEEVVVPEFPDVLQQFFGGLVVKLGQVEVAGADFQGADGLEQALFQVGADAHDFAGGLHLGAQSVGSGGELVEGEPGQLGNHIVQAGLEGSVGVGNLDVFQCHAHGDLGSDPGDGVAGSLGSQSGGAGHTGVDLDQVVLGGVGVQGKLHVAAAFDLQFPNDLDGGIVQHLLIFRAQGHDGSHNQAVAGVHAYRVDVFHAADGDGVVVAVTHNLELDFLVALDALLNQNLVHRGQTEGIQAHFHQFFFVVGKAAAGAAQGEGGTQNHGVADALGSSLGLLDGVGDFRGDNRLADGLAQLLEQLPVLSTLDGLAGGTQQLDPALFQNALLLQLHGQVQTGLTADAGDDGVRTLIADNLCHIFQGQGLHVDLVGDDGVGHDGSGVGVAQHNLVTFFL